MEALRYVCWKRYGVDGTDIARKLDNISYPPHYLLGGIDGRAFMVLRVGLVPPHYGKGVVN